ncbi:MAG: hypothetical protein PVSMB4_17970 [Ktedonobacterales bacterium]
MAISPLYQVHPPERLSVGARGIPALLIRPQASDRRPAAVIQHGYGADKTDVVPLAHFLAERGFVALLPDAWGHGERFPHSGPNWMSELSADYFLEVLRHTICDIGTCLDAIEQRSDVRPDALLMAGFSMGAMAALLVGPQDPRVAAVISASGSAAPDLLNISIAGSRLAGPETCAWALEHDAATQLARLAPRPLLLQHGRLDDMVPLANTLRLYQEAEPHYTDHPERLGLMLYDHRHTVSSRQIEDAAEWVTPFFADRDETAA